jgi:hypothetical protein
MAATINVDLDVDQAKFLAFYQAFDKFSKGLDGAGSKFKKMDKSVDALRMASEAVNDNLRSGFESSRKLVDAQKSFRDASVTASRAWRALELSTKNFAYNIKDATMSVLRWSGLTGLIGGGIFGASVLGMGALGSSVTSERSAAMGAGTTYGRRQAFNIAFGRFGDPEGTLSRVSTQMASADHSALRNLGITDEQIKNMDPAELAALAYQRLGQMARRVNPNMLKDWMHQRRIDEVFDLGQARQAVSATKSGEMGEVQGAFAKNKDRFELSTEAQRAWAKFSMNMEIAAGILKKTFVGALSKLTPSLTKLSHSFTRLVEKLMADNGPLAHGLDALAKWLDETTKTITEENIRKWITDFFEGVKGLVTSTAGFVKAIASFLRWFGITPAHASTRGGESVGSGAGSGAAGGGAESGSNPGGASAPARGSGGSTGRGESGQAGGTSGGATPLKPGAGGTSGRGTASVRGGGSPLARGGDTTPMASGEVSGGGGSWKGAIDRAAKAEGIDPRLMYGIVAGESGHGAGYDHGDYGKSYGPFQAYTGGGLGNQMIKEGIDVRDPSTADAQARWVAHYIKQHGIKSYGGPPWYGNRGAQNWNPSWGKMGYQPPHRTTVTVNKPPGNDHAHAANAAAQQTP